MGGRRNWFMRKLVWLYRKIVQEKASPEYIARGWAIGMFYGCLIPFGLQLVLSIPTSFILKGSKIGATLGTLITNHVTIFFIYPVQCWVGNRLLGGNLSIDYFKSNLYHVMEEQSFSMLLDLGLELLESFFVGGLLFTLIMTPITYFVVLKIVKKYQARKNKKRLLKQQACQ